jgi:hypothetical protein
VRASLRPEGDTFLSVPDPLGRALDDSPGRLGVAQFNLSSIGKAIEGTFRRAEACYAAPTTT